MNAEINSGFLLSGTARVFENVVTYRLKDTKNNILAQGNLIAAAPDIGQFGPFETNVSYSAPVTQFGYLEVFTLSAKDGSEIDKQILYLKFGQWYNLAMADSESVDIRFPQATIQELEKLADSVGIEKGEKEQRIISVVGRAVRLLNLASQGDQTQIIKGPKIYPIDIKTL